jgi:hypothetical protein
VPRGALRAHLSSSPNKHWQTAEPSSGVEILLKANVIDESEELILGQVLSGWGT